MVSVADCHLAGDIVVIYTWTDPISERQANLTIAGPATYWSTGAGWTQIMGDDNSDQAELAIASNVDRALAGTVHNTTTKPPYSPATTPMVRPARA